MKIFTRLKAFSHTLETKIQANLYRRQLLFKELQGSQNPKVMMGQFNAEGSNKFYSKHPLVHYKTLSSNNSLRISSVGVGTYKGSYDQKDDLLMFNGLVDSVLLGCNVLDTCRNFRKGRSEKTLGLALRYLCQQEGYERSSFFLASKAGYVFEDLPQGVTSSQVINDHCVHPQFLKSQLQASLKSLGVSSIDAYYLNNFAQCQMQSLGKQQFQNKLAKAFETLQKARSQGKIKHYGLSSWQAFRECEGSPGHLSLQTVMRIAEKVAGNSHGMRLIQIPINIMMPQSFADKYIEGRSFLDIAQEFKLNVISNSPLLSGTLINIPMPASILKCNNNGAKHLQLIRSIPSKALVSTLVGHKLNRHVRKNLQVLEAAPLDEDEWLSVFVPKSQPTPMSA